MKLIIKYFPNLSLEQVNKLILFSEYFIEYNTAINMISRKDVENLEERHILHSLAIAKIISFKPFTKILDLGTGGGFPGIPLAIMFPEVKFYLVDSIAKKIKLVGEMAAKLNLKNVESISSRAETLNTTFDFVISRAVAPISKIYQWTHKLIVQDHYNDMPNGFLLLKGGDLKSEKMEFKTLYPKSKKIKEFPIKNYFDLEFFETKKVIYCSV